MKHELINRVDSVELLIKRLQGRPFVFTRFGDGDYVIMYRDSIGRIIGKSNGFVVTKRLQEELIECHNINDKDFLIASVINDRSERSTFKNIRESKLLPLKAKKEMLIFSCLMDTFIDDSPLFLKFAEEMRKTSTLFVCSYNHPNLNMAYGEIKHYVKIPQRNCYATIDKWFPEIVSNLDKADKIVLSAGFAGRVLAKRLKDCGKTIIDVGSLSDMLIMNTEIINTIPQRSHLRIYKDQILKSLGELLGYEVKSELKIVLKSRNRKRKRLSNISRSRERNIKLIDTRRR